MPPLGADELSCQQFNMFICVVVIGLMCLLGIVGNTTSVFVLWKHKTDSATIFLLQALCIADSVLLVTSLSMYTFPALYLRGENLEQRQENLFFVNTTFIWPVGMMAHTATIWLTVLVTINRYCSICRPLSSGPKNAIKNSQIQVLIVLLLSVVYNIPRFFEHHPVGQQQDNHTDNNSSTGLEPTLLGGEKLYQIIYSNILYFAFMYIVPLLSLIVLNWKLIKALKDIRKRKETLTGHKPPEDHITLCIIAIVFVFLLCQTPALINQIFWVLGEHADRECGKFHFYYTKISDVLVVINSSVNFVIYCLFGKSFRQIFCDVLCNHSCKRTVNKGYKSANCKTGTVPMEEL